MPAEAAGAHRGRHSDARTRALTAHRSPLTSHLSPFTRTRTRTRTLILTLTLTLTLPLPLPLTKDSLKRVTQFYGLPEMANNTLPHTNTQVRASPSPNPEP